MQTSCAACNKVYGSKGALKKHLKRQPLCEQWVALRPGIKDYVDDRFMLPLTDMEKQDMPTKCFVCATQFANVGNLNRHLDASTICSKWRLYRDLQPLQSYMEPHTEPHTAAGVLPQACTVKGACSSCDAFEAPKYSLCHIIWNVFLIDKEFAASHDMRAVVEENNVKYVIAIMPDTSTYKGCMRSCWVDHCVMEYDGHTTSLDVAAYDAQCAKIEVHRSRRENVIVMCNSGYQRSLGFLCYYLMKFHPSEVPSVERAIDTILPQVDKQNYAAVRGDYIESIRNLLSPVLPLSHSTAPTTDACGST